MSATDPTGPAASPLGANPLMTLHYTMQGKYLIALAAASVVAAVVGVLVYRSHVPLYESEGWVRISPDRDVVLDEEVLGDISMFSDYVRVQGRRMKSFRVVDNALRGGTWAERPSGTGPSSVRGFQDQLTVRTEPQIIAVRFRDENPQTAQKGVEALVKAFAAVYDEADSREVNERLDKLTSVQVQLSNELRGVRQRQSTLAKRYGFSSNDADGVYELKSTRLQSLQARLQEVERLIKLHELPQEEQIAARTDHTPAQIATVDATMQNLVQRKTLAEQAYRAQIARFGEAHRTTRKLAEEITIITDEIARRTDAFNRGELELQLGSGAADATGAVSLAQLRGQADEFRRQVAATQSELEELNRQRVDLDEVDREISLKESKLRETEAKIDAIQIESTTDGRLEIGNEGDLPGSPSNDADQFRNAAAAGMGSGAAIVGLVLLWGLADRRLKSYAAAKNMLGADAFLGMLPILDESLDDAQQALGASHAVHEIRSMLQRARPDGEPLVVGVTSATAGAGKTSVSLALGLSFAAAGSRTLLIDFDAVGGGLSSRTLRIVRRRQAESLARQGVLHEAGVAQVLELMDEQPELGMAEAADRLGLATASRVSAALSTDATGHTGRGAGVFESLAGAALEECVLATGVERLTVLPLGEADIAEIGTVSRGGIRGLINRARSSYDVVVVDSGPILGSLEASIASGEVDELIVVVAKGELVGYVRRAIDRALDAGAKVAGLVFNKADTTDGALFGSAGTTSLVSRVVSRPDSLTPVSVTLRDAEECPREYGPLAHATAACLPGSSRRGLAKSVGRTQGAA
ncbi:MAG: hypothetical protein AAF823_09795 [Planctomycetota bacterium]